MIINTDREKFFQSFQLASTVAATRDVKPVLQNVKIKVESETYLMATDNEIGIRVACDGTEIVKSGDAILPIKQVRQILQTTRVEKLQIASDGGKMVIKGTGIHFKLDSMDADDFPDISAYEADAYHEIPCKIMKELIRRTVFATDEENTRYS